MNWGWRRQQRVMQWLCLCSGLGIAFLSLAIRDTIDTPIVGLVGLLLLYAFFGVATRPHGGRESDRGTRSDDEPKARQQPQDRIESILAKARERLTEATSDRQGVVEERSASNERHRRHTRHWRRPAVHVRGGPHRLGAI